MSGAADMASQLIEALDLAPHPEGGWFREIWRAEAGGGPADGDQADGGQGNGGRADGGRAGASSIHFLLEAHQASHWHKVDATEIWLWHAGDPLKLSLASSDAGPVREVRLGPQVLAGDVPQHVIPPHQWQAAAPLPGEHGYTLVSCIVAPAFEFAGFVLAAPGWRPGR